MRQQPPISQLLPYTTLFRSRTKSATQRISYPMMRSIVPPNLLPRFWAHAAEARARSLGSWTRSTDQDHRDKLQLAPLDLDRKNTRLNSSHGYISYAVFVLKN